VVVFLTTIILPSILSSVVMSSWQTGEGDGEGRDVETWSVGISVTEGFSEAEDVETMVLRTSVGRRA